MTHERATVLLDAHRALGAKLTEFGGWEMPLQYEGIIAEHRAVREKTGVFDVSHLGKLRVAGAGAGDALQEAVTCDVMSLAPGRASYSLVLTEDAGCVDDVFVYRFAEDEWLVVPNASNVEAVAGMIRASGTEPVDEWDRWTILAIQGPGAFDAFEALWPEARATELKLHDFARIDVFGEEGFVARTGYTGERGFELYAPVGTAGTAWEKLLDHGVSPVGLGARDTLRLEMGYALYGHEISLEINPLEAGLGWVLDREAPYRGREAVERIRAEGRRRKLFGVACRDKGVPRQGYEVYAGEGEIGVVTSGNFSPTLGTGIALALGPVEKAPEEGAEVHVSARGRRIAGDIVKPPFIKKGSH
jgi:aminomethyltransferase